MVPSLMKNLVPPHLEQLSTGFDPEHQGSAEISEINIPQRFSRGVGKFTRDDNGLCGHGGIGQALKIRTTVPWLRSTLPQSMLGAQVSVKGSKT